MPVKMLRDHETEAVNGDKPVARKMQRDQESTHGEGDKPAATITDREALIAGLNHDLAG